MEWVGEWWGGGLESFLTNLYCISLKWSLKCMLHVTQGMLTDLFGGFCLVISNCTQSWSSTIPIWGWVSGKFTIATISHSKKQETNTWWESKRRMKKENKKRCLQWGHYNMRWDKIRCNTKDMQHTTCKSFWWKDCIDEHWTHVREQVA